LTFTASNSIIKIMVYKSVISPVGIKFADPTGWSFGEIKVSNTKINQWEELTFNFSSRIGQKVCDQIIIFPDFPATRTVGSINYWDNILFTGPTSVENRSLGNSWSIFPNPVTNELIIKNIQEEGSISIYELNGRQMFQKTTNSTSEKFDVSKLKNGVYFIRVSGKSGVKTGKFIKQ
jgi:hypothetical protein